MNIAGLLGGIALVSTLSSSALQDVRGCQSPSQTYIWQNFWDCEALAILDRPSSNIPAGGPSITVEVSAKLVKRIAGRIADSGFIKVSAMRYIVASTDLDRKVACLNRTKTGWSILTAYQLSASDAGPCTEKFYRHFGSLREEILAATDPVQRSRVLLRVIDAVPFIDERGDALGRLILAHPSGVVLDRDTLAAGLMQRVRDNSIPFYQAHSVLMTMFAPFGSLRAEFSTDLRQLDRYNVAFLEMDQPEIYCYALAYLSVRHHMGDVSVPYPGNDAGVCLTGQQLQDARKYWRQRIECGGPVDKECP